MPNKIKYGSGTTVSVSIVVSLIAVVVNMAWPIFLWAFLLALLTFQLPKSLKSLVSIRVTAILLVVLAILQLESLSFWALGIKANIIIYNLVLLGLVLGNMVLHPARNKNIFDTNNLRPKWSDCLIILPALLISGLLWVRAIPSSHDSHASVVQSISLGMDDATHAMMYNDMVRSDGNLLVRPSETIKMSLPQFGSYTRGWHVATAVFASSFDNLKSKPVINVIESYFSMKLLSLLVTILMLGAFTFTLCKQLKLNLRSVIEYLTILLAIMAMAVVLLMPSYFEGFFSFLPAISYLLLFSTIIIGKTNREEELSTSIVLGLSAAASAMTWALLAPVLIIAIIAKKILDYGGIRKIPVVSYVFFLLTTLFCAIQAYIVFYGNKASISIISAEGGIVAPTHLLLFLLLSTFLAFYIWDKTSTLLARNFLTIIIPSSLALVAILLYITIKSQTITYYFSKFQLFLMVILLPLSLVLLVKLVFRKPSHLLIEQAGRMCLIVLIMGLSIPSILGYDYFRYILKSAVGRGTLSSEDSSMIVSQSLNRSFKNDNTRIIFFYPDQPSRSVISSNIARTSYLSSDCDQDIFNAMYRMDIQLFEASIEKCNNVIHPTIIGTDKLGYDKMNRELSQSVQNGGHVSFIVSK